MPEMGYVSLVSQATLVVQLVLAILVVMSVISWKIIIAKFFSLGGVMRRLSAGEKLFEEAEDMDSAMRSMAGAGDSTAGRVAEAGLRELSRFKDYKGDEDKREEASRDNLRRALRQAISTEVGRLSGSLPFLATCSNAAPFIGLFGTVWGIMHSFHSIGQMKTAALAVVAPGISEALVATAIGLAVAIPATIAYNHFVGRLGMIEAELVNFAGVFLNRAQREGAYSLPPGRNESA